MSQYPTNPPPPPTAPEPAPKTSHKLRNGLVIGGAVVAVLVVAGAIGSAGKNSAGTSTVTTATATVTHTIAVTLSPDTKTVAAAPATVTATAAAEPVTVTAAPPPAEFKDGTNIVGVDVQPGTYRSSNADCYYERLKDFNGTIDSIISNGNGPVVITIDSKDKAFTSHSCAPWTQVS